MNRLVTTIRHMLDNDIISSAEMASLLEIKETSIGVLLESEFFIFPPDGLHRLFHRGRFFNLFYLIFGSESEPALLTKEVLITPTGRLLVQLTVLFISDKIKFTDVQKYFDQYELERLCEGSLQLRDKHIINAIQSFGLNPVFTFDSLLSKKAPFFSVEPK